MSAVPIEHQQPPLYAWVVQAADKRWGILGAVLPGLGPTQLVFGNRRTAEVCRPVAKAHHMRTGEPTRLVEFGAATILEDLPA